jgi:hypothetical protein
MVFEAGLQTRDSHELPTREHLARQLAIALLEDV